MTLLSGGISLVPGPEKRALLVPRRTGRGAAAQHALPSLTCAPLCVHRALFRQQKRGQQTWQAETGTAPKTQQGEQRLPGEPEEQALYVNPQPGSLALGFMGGDGRKDHGPWQGCLGRSKVQGPAGASLLYSSISSFSPKRYPPVGVHPGHPDPPRAE